MKKPNKNVAVQRQVKRKKTEIKPKKKKQVKSKFIIRYNDRFKFWWDTFIIWIAVVSFFLITMSVAFPRF